MVNAEATEKFISTDTYIRSRSIGAGFGVASASAPVLRPDSPSSSSSISDFPEERALTLHKFKSSNPSPSQKEIVENWQNWEKERTYCSIPTVYEKVKRDGTYEILGILYRFVRASKRGNEIYNYNTTERFKEIESRIPSLDYFDTSHKYDTKIKRETSALFISLTYDQSRISWREAWQSVSHDINLFRAKVRQEFKSQISSIRCFESQKNGYPHIHLLIFFKDYKFRVHFKDSSKKGKKGKWRIDYKIMKRLASFWGFGFKDVSGVYNSTKAFRYIGKYLFKTLASWGKEDKLTLALCWYFRKRSFSLIGANSFFLNADVLADFSDLNIPVVVTKIMPLFLDSQQDIFGDSVIFATSFFGGLVFLDSPKGKPPPRYVEYWEKDIPAFLEALLDEKYSEFFLPILSLEELSSLESFKAYLPPSMALLPKGLREQSYKADMSDLHLRYFYLAKDRAYRDPFPQEDSSFILKGRLGRLKA